MGRDEAGLPEGRKSWKYILDVDELVIEARVDLVNETTRMVLLDKETSMVLLNREEFGEYI